VRVGRTAAAGLVPLQLAVQDPQPVFTDVRLSEFVGREWLFDQVDRFLTEQACGFVIIQADAGLGKTTLAARLVQQQGFLSHFTCLGGKSATAALRNLAAQLITRFDLHDLAPGNVVPEWAHTTDRFATLLNHAAQKVTATGERIVLVVDGLDAAEPVETGLPLGLPAVLPEGAFVIATCRPGTALPVESPNLWLSITPGQAENTTDVHHFLSRTAQEPVIAIRLVEAGVPAEKFVATLLQRCGGLWVYLRYILDEIRFGYRTITDLDDLPQALVEYYTQALRVGQDDQQWEHVGLPVWAALAAAQEPLTLETIACLSGSLDPGAVRRLCESRYQPFLTVTNTHPRRYAIYHTSLREYLTGTLPTPRHGTPPNTIHALTDQLADAVKHAHSRIAAYYLSAFGGLENHLNSLAADPALARQDDGYPLRHLATHLAHAGRIDDLHALLTCEHPTGTGQAYNVWHQAHDHAGTLHNYLADITRAQAYARAATDRYLATGQTIPHLGLELLYTLITASLTSLTNQIPTDLVLRLVEAGIWTPQRALHYALRLTSESDRAEVLTALAPHLPPDLVPHALHAATAITSDYARAKALTALALHLPPDQRHTALHHAYRAAAAITNDYARAKALSGLAEHLPPAERRDALRQALQTATYITDEFDRADVLTALAHPLPPDQRHTAFHHAHGVTADDAAHAEASADSAEHLPFDLLQALQAVTAITDEYARAQALADLAEYLPLEERHTTLHHALQVATAATDDYARAKALSGLARHLPPDLLHHALQTATHITDEYARAQALADLAEYLPLEERHTTLHHALQAITALTDDTDRAEVLTAIAPLLPPVLIPQALQTATHITEGYPRVRALASLAPHLPPDQRHVLFHQARKTATAVDNPVRAWALIALIPHLPSEERLTTLHHALQAITALTSDYARAEALTELADHLPPTLLPQALHVATAIGQQTVRAQALSRILTRFHQEELVTRIQQAARTTTFDSEGVELFAHCVKSIPHDLHGLVTIARSLTTGASRATVLKFLATAAPLINQYGGTSAVRYCLDAVMTACRWFTTPPLRSRSRSVTR